MKILMLFIKFETNLKLKNYDISNHAYYSPLKNSWQLANEAQLRL